MNERADAIGFVRSALTAAQARGLDLESVLREAKLPAKLLEQNAEITPRQATKLIQSLWRETGDELLGLGPIPIPRGTFRLVSLALIHATDLGAGLNRLAEFTQLISTLMNLRVIEDGEQVRIEISTVGQRPAEPFLLELAFSVIHRFAAWLIGREIRILALGFPGDSTEYFSDYRWIFGCTPSFGAERAFLSFDAALLAAPLVRSEEDLFEFIKNSPADLILRRDYSTAVSKQVRKVFERTEQGYSLSSQDVAAKLSLSVQHLRRLLSEEGTSFRQIREDVLLERAGRLLQQGALKVEEISEQLGFSEPSAFRRAFHRWAGVTPTEFRSKLDLD